VFDVEEAAADEAVSANDGEAEDAIEEQVANLG